MKKCSFQIPAGLLSSLSSEATEEYEQITVTFDYSPSHCFLRSLYEMCLWDLPFTLAFLDNGTILSNLVWSILCLRFISRDQRSFQSAPLPTKTTSVRSSQQRWWRPPQSLWILSVPSFLSLRSSSLSWMFLWICTLRGSMQPSSTVSSLLWIERMCSV